MEILFRDINNEDICGGHRLCFITDTPTGPALWSGIVKRIDDMMTIGAETIEQVKNPPGWKGPVNWIDTFHFLFKDAKDPLPSVVQIAGLAYFKDNRRILNTHILRGEMPLA